MPGGVLLVTADPSLMSAVPRLCALAGVECEVDRDSGAARVTWRSAPAILVGADVAPALAAAALPRRDRVLVLTTGPADVACWQAALALGASTVIRLPDEEALLVEELRAPSRAAVVGTRAIAVVGGCGGAGASTLAAALAIVAARSSATVLIDGDPLGGGLDVLLGAESVPGVRWSDLAATRGRLDASAFASAVSDVAGVGLLSWGRPGNGATTLTPEAVHSVLDAASRGFESVVIDVPRSSAGVTESLLDIADTAVLLVPAEVRAVSATAALVASVGRRLGAPLLVVRDPGGSSLAAKDVAASLGMALTATLRSDAAVKSAAQRGELPVRRGRCGLSQVCELLLAAATCAGTD